MITAGSSVRARLNGDGMDTHNVCTRDDSICLRQVEQTANGVIRSYVVTFSFVIFRVLHEAFDMAQLGTMAERLTAASWFAWAGPLFITESILQGRKIFVRRPRVAPVEEPAAFSAVPEPAVFDLQNRS